MMKNSQKGFKIKSRKKASTIHWFQWGLNNVMPKSFFVKDPIVLLVLLVPLHSFLNKLLVWMPRVTSRKQKHQNQNPSILIQCVAPTPHCLEISFISFNQSNVFTRQLVLHNENNSNYEYLLPSARHYAKLFIYINSFNMQFQKEGSTIVQMRTPRLRKVIYSVTQLVNVGIVNHNTNQFQPIKHYIWNRTHVYTTTFTYTRGHPTVSQSLLYSQSST